MYATACSGLKIQNVFSDQLTKWDNIQNQNVSHLWPFSGQQPMQIWFPGNNEIINQSDVTGTLFHLVNAERQEKSDS